MSAPEVAPTDGRAGRQRSGHAPRQEGTRAPAGRASTAAAIQRARDDQRAAAAAGQLEIVDRSGAPLEGAQTTWVGKKVQLAVRIRGGGTPQNIQWTIPDPKIGAFVATVQAGAKHEIEASELREARLGFYWLSAGTKAVQVRGQVNGQAAQAAVTFNVRRPAVDRFTTAVSSINICAPGTHALMPGHRDELLSAFAPHAGAARADQTDRGCRFHAEISGAEAGGKVGFLQKIKSDRRLQWEEGGQCKLTTLTTNGAWLLDHRTASLMYREEDVGADGRKTIESSDSPLQSVLWTFVVRVEEEFRLFLMYRPPGDDSIWVPLKGTAWHWKAGAHRASPQSAWSALCASELWSRPSAWDETDPPVWEGDMQSVREAERNIAAARPGEAALAHMAASIRDPGWSAR